MERKNQTEQMITWLTSNGEAMVISKPTLHNEPTA